jgi:hypothetical protein
MTTIIAGLPVDHVGGAALDDARRRVRGCARPVRLVGSVTRLDPATGQVLSAYSSAGEVDGVTYVRCGDRRAQRCESCSREYKGDAWHLLAAGLAGNDDKGVPATVTGHPAVFATLTAPSFGPVHGRRRGGLCRPRRDRPVCPHGRPLYCLARHDHDDPRLGDPLCVDCYRYGDHVLWQWHAPELWRRYTLLLRAALARRVGLTVTRFRDLARLSYTKVVEFQARGVIHVHAVIRLDGPDGPDTSSPVAAGPSADKLAQARREAYGYDPYPARLTADDLAAAIRDVAGRQRLTIEAPGRGPVALRWGEQVDTRVITGGAGRDDTTGQAHPEQVAAYLAKYLTKSTEDFGLDGHGRVHSATDAHYLGASDHAVRLIEAAEQLVEDGGEDYERLAARYGTLGYRGHPITKTRRCSTTFKALRQARRDWHTNRRPPGVDPAELPADDDHHGDTADVIVESAWAYAGTGYLTTEQAAAALTAACLARQRNRRQP